MGPDLRRPGAGGALEQGADPRGLPQSGAFSRQPAGHCGGFPGALPEAAQRTQAARSRHPGSAAARPNARPALVERRACELLQRVGARIECASMRLALAKLDHGMPAPRWNGAAGLLARRLQMRPGDRCVLPSILHGRRPRWQPAIPQGMSTRRVPMLRYRSWWSTVPTPAWGLRRSGRGRGTRWRRATRAGDSAPVLGGAGDRTSVPDRGDTDSRTRWRRSGGVGRGRLGERPHGAAADPRRLMALPGERRLFELAPDGGRRIIDIDHGAARFARALRVSTRPCSIRGVGWRRACWARRRARPSLLRPEAAFIAADMLRAEAPWLRTQLLGAGTATMHGWWAVWGLPRWC